MASFFRSALMAATRSPISAHSKFSTPSPFYPNPISSPFSSTSGTTNPQASRLVSAFGKVESLKPLHRLNSPARIKSKGFLLKPGPQICVVIRYFDRLPVENRSADPKKKIASPPKMTNPKITITLTNTERPCLDDRLPGRRVRLPETRRLYTLLRSPHVHKKSREQFWIRTNKQCLVIQTTEKDEWKRKLFWLKNGRAFL
ncbi:uncharacterized protein LOC21401511 [Morus notabilis]|uniref:uncharacterized protein LOC21401511 n=1 Tax=Morus notabilis TaxID=981085 RepID=UPI000CED389F|nr:uncharacterized protein LOC21401511 [Morus notabilis]